MIEDPIEHALREALRPINPGEGFVEQVLERLPADAPRSPGGRERLRRWLPLPLAPALAVAACLLIGAGLTLWRYSLAPPSTAAPASAALWQQELAARAQLLQALRIAGDSVNAARAEVIRIEIEQVSAAQPSPRARPDPLRPAPAPSPQPSLPLHQERS